MAVTKLSGRAIAFGVLTVGAIAGLSTHHSAGSGVDGATKEAIYSTCHDAVKDQLTAPAGANFHDEKIAKAASGWSLTGEVDSQNAYGATLTAGFSCETDHSGIAEPPASVD